MNPPLRHACLAVLLGLVGFGASAPVLAAELSQPLPLWQARLQLSSLGSTPGTEAAPRLGGSRLLSANLLGDYYLTNSGSGGPREGLQGGVRLTGGMLLGPLSLTQSSGGLALGTGLGASHFSLGQRALNPSGPEAFEPSSTLSYLGVGYSGQWSGSGLSFSADLGLVSGVGSLSGLSSASSLRLGRSNAQGLDDALRDLRFKPVLQLGLSYSY